MGAKRRELCLKGHPMADSYVINEKDGYTRRRCATCRKERQEKWKRENAKAIQNQQVGYREQRRERSWRFKLWETAHIEKSLREQIESQQMTMVYRDELSSPMFVFELGNKRRVEFLTDALPEWEQ